LKPLFRLTLPMLGARHEWDAILRFGAAGIATMTPVAYGRRDGRSFVVTAALDGCTKLSDLARESLGGPNHAQLRREMIAAVAGIARSMHAAGMHHQDFYLAHLLLRKGAESDEPRVYVIDLGRARAVRKLAGRWIVKDLAQLDYSAGLLSRSERMRFLRAYLGRRLDAGDGRLIRRISRKSAAIARHSTRNRL
jgi:heptose I phosphotransferase